MSDSLRPHELQPASLLCPWNIPGKNTGVGCYFFSSPGDLPDPGIEPVSFASPALGGGFLTTSGIGEAHCLFSLTKGDAFLSPNVPGKSIRKSVSAPDEVLTSCAMFPQSAGHSDHGSEVFLEVSCTLDPRACQDLREPVSNSPDLGFESSPQPQPQSHHKIPFLESTFQPFIILKQTGSFVLAKWVLL